MDVLITNSYPQQTFLWLGNNKNFTSTVYIMDFEWLEGVSSFVTLGGAIL